MAEEIAAPTLTAPNIRQEVDADHGKEISGEESPPQRSSNDGSRTATAKEEQAVKEETAKPKDSMVQKLIAKIGLDVGTVMMMFKGSVAPAIGIAFYQADGVAKTYSTIGYLVPIVTVLSMPIMPRAKYFQTITLNLIGICIGASIALLGIWSGVQARKHTTPVGSIAAYNSSQSAVCAIWLFANIYFVNALRAKMPALNLPVIMYSIFTNVAFTYGPLFPTMGAGISLVKRLLEAFSTAFAIATAVHLFIIPISSRTVVFKEFTGYLGAVRGVMKAQTAYLQSLESSDMFADAADEDERAEGNGKKHKNDKKEKAHPAQTSPAKDLKGAVSGLLALHGKLYGDLPFAKREIAWGKLCAKDIDEIFALFRDILIPLIGLSTSTDIFERIAERRGWLKSTYARHDKIEAWEDCDESAKNEEKRVWNEMMKTLHEPFAVVVGAMDEAMEHVGLVLEFNKSPKKKKGEDDVEAKGTDPRPGDPEFSKFLDQKLKDFYGNRGQTLKAWARNKGLSEEIFDQLNEEPKNNRYTPGDTQHARDQQQLYLILYLEFLLYSAGRAILKLVEFADKKVSEGSMKKNRLILPGQRRIKKWILSIGEEDASVDTNSPDSMENGSSNIFMGAGFNPVKDPEHLPPATVWQHFGNYIRKIPHFLRSTESVFGFRVACATLTVGIIAFLKDTQSFFMEQRLVWAMIIIVRTHFLIVEIPNTNVLKAIGMTMTSGQSIFGFLCRMGGTFAAMVLSIIIWYIPDHKTSGVIVILWFFIFLEMYFFLKHPRFMAVWLISIVTEVLIIGYELQVRKIGLAAATSSGQPYYPIYELAPYRLACVAGGSFVAFIWTIFPYPLSDRSWLRKDLGSTLYLLANYYSVVHSTINARMHGTEGDMELKDSPGRKLEKVRYKIFQKLLVLLPSLQQHADWEKYELTFGGKFPKETYENIALRANNILNYLTLISYATRSWSDASCGPAYPNATTAARRAWLSDLSLLMDTVKPTSHSITSTLALLSAAVLQGSALPPYMVLPEPYNLSKRLEALDKGILDARHVEEPGYSAYAVMQVASGLVTDDLARLVEHVRDLVGETDFSFRVDISDSSLDSTGTERSSGKGDGNGKGKRE
ncbi:Uncharacterized protein LSUB1_G004247 [Lachnellula subtilissima]|uniref:ER transporter 6TM N-terminal domain-containing protein n=1 Tax=Lachnellula subtilissima TaxID=602034 RepID=A0A8H8UCK9_9HELO|nr:Uncharacterized protein LSUB1_G004247 [Lachnellula subtilissima]